MKKFTHRNESFICEHCGAKNPPAENTCRNHCRECLHSKHVDQNPGDRQATCSGLMKPIGVEIKGGLPKKIQFQCEKCNFLRPNKILDDDNRETVYGICKNQ